MELAVVIILINKVPEANTIRQDDITVLPEVRSGRIDVVRTTPPGVSYSTPNRKLGSGTFLGIESMNRPPGSRNRDFEEQRRALLERVGWELVAEHGRPPSLRKLAESAGVSAPTLRHYFGDGDRLVEEALGHLGTEHLQAMVEDDADSLESTVRSILADLTAAWVPYRVGAILESGLALGVQSSIWGCRYTRAILDPIVDAVATRFARHIERGEMAEVDPRFAALSLLGPVLLALMHQHGLHGQQTNPLDIHALLDQHIAGFVTAYGRE